MAVVETNAGNEGAVTIGSDTQPLVSVILPTYPNDVRMPYLGQAIASALAQTYTNLELIVSDNSMSDRVRDLVASFGDARVRYRHNGGNIGPLLNALVAYREAQGPLIATLFDDDIWEPTFLEKLVPPMAADDTLTMSFCDHWVISADGTIDHRATEINTRRWKRDRLAPGVHRPFIDLAVVDRAIPVGMGAVFRKSAIDWDDFPEEVFVYDLWLGYLAARDGGGAFYCPERLTRYRVHEEMMTSNTRYDSYAVYCYDRFIRDERLKPLRRQVLAESAGFHAGLGITLLEEGRRHEARRHLVWAFRHRPQLKALAGILLSFLPQKPAVHIGRARRIRAWFPDFSPRR
ncbi:MAG: hypothetical protein QOJ19_407 [Acidimicrobiia bacterium]|jgi:glycosyltransferase involved in cell wall biosynthesis|nr:hypothetical protein [Acidimicrobiia bacterium]